MRDACFACFARRVSLFVVERPLDVDIHVELKSLRSVQGMTGAEKREFSAGG